MMIQCGGTYGLGLGNRREGIGRVGSVVTNEWVSHLVLEEVEYIHSVFMWCNSVNDIRCLFILNEFV